MKEIFQNIEPPPSQKDNNININSSAKWYTWSLDFKPFLKSWKNMVLELGDLELVSLLDGRPYDYTYSLEPSNIVDKNLRDDLILVANALYNLKISDEIMFFSDLLSDDFDGRSLHFLFAAIRGALAKIGDDPMCALYPPLGTANQGAIQHVLKGFPLHADLYVPKLLFNVFDDVPHDSSGSSLFLHVSELASILYQMKSISEIDKNKIMNCLSNNSFQDRYEEFFNLLHGREHSWVEELERNMTDKQKSIKLHSGQGYLIHDNFWLHGRDIPSRAITEKRLHRLVFNTRQIQERHVIHKNRIIKNQF